ncbi:MAG: hypothetical protein QM813_09040, partial [Verrucomicrobiota bacterium]
MSMTSSSTVIITSENFDFLPVAAMSEKEMFALLVADKAIAQYRGMPFRKPLRMAFTKLTGQLDKVLFGFYRVSLLTLAKTGSNEKEGYIT